MGSRLINLKNGGAFTGNLRFAVFGTGYWSTLQIPAWNEVGGVELVAAYNRTVEKAERLAQSFGIRGVYGDPEELLKSEDIDFIDIITEVPAHEQLVMLAAKYKIPVICQKPMSFSYESCERMVGACRDAGIPFFINENFRWQPPFRAIKEVLNENPVGKVFRAHIQLGTGGPETFVIQPFLKTLKHCALTDMGSHIFDLARFYFGEAQRIYCETFISRDFLAGEDIASAMLRLGDVTCTCDICERYNSRVFVEGTGGTIELKNDNRIYINTEKGCEVRDITWPRYSWISSEDEKLHGSDCIHSIVTCQRHLLECLRNGTDAGTSGTDNLKTARLVFKAIESTETKRVIELR